MFMACHLRARSALLALVALTLPVASAHADLADAMAAYKARDFETARRQFLQFAELGEPRAQFNLGAMALRGEGMAKDDGVAAGWVRAAVQNGYKGFDESRLQLIEAGLGSSGQAAAAEIVRTYGRDALLGRVLPAQPPLRCKRRFAPPRVQQMAKPNYPAGPLRDGLDGVVIMQFTVGLDGLARDPEILAAAPLEKFDAAAIRAILKSRFQPALLDGTPFEARMQIRYTFMIRGGGDLWSVGAVQEAKKAADAGSPGAQYLVGVLGLLDPSLKIPENQARQMVLSAAQTGHPEAQYWVGNHLQYEAYCNDSNKMRIWAERAAESEFATAKIFLARLLLAQPDASADLEKISTLLREAAQSHDPYSVKHATALLALPPNDRLRDAAAALAAAKSLDRMDADYDPQVSEVIAAAYAANGDYAQAVKQQQRALDTAEDLYWNDTAMQAKLATYKESKVWTGDLLALPAATEPLPEVDNPSRGCRRSDGKCERTPDTKRQRTGSQIAR